MIKHVWFDCAGTLYRENAAIDKARNALRYSEYARLVGITDATEAEQKYHQAYAKAGSNSAVFSSLGMPDDYWQTFSEDMDISRLVNPNPVINTALSEIAAARPISIFSNFRVERMQKILRALDIDSAMFTHIIGGSGVPARKPDLSGFTKIVELSGVDASKTMYVGDRVKADILPAKALGMVTCLVWDRSPEADYSSPDWSDLPQIIEAA